MKLKMTIYFNDERDLSMDFGFSNNGGNREIELFVGEITDKLNKQEFVMLGNKDELNIVRVSDIDYIHWDIEDVITI